MGNELDHIGQDDVFVLTSRKIATTAEGFDPRSPYVERFWLPFLGPSTTLLLRHLAWQLECRGESAEVRGSEIAKAIGLGERPGRHAPFVRALRRASSFDLLLLQPAPDTTNRVLLRIRQTVPQLPNRLLERLSAELVAEHASAVDRGPDDPAQVRRAQQLAQTLADLGESDDDVLSQLVAWRIEPHLARRAAFGRSTLRPATDLEASSR